MTNNTENRLPKNGLIVRYLDKEKSWNIVLFEHELADLLAPVLLVPGRLGEEDGMRLGLGLCRRECFWPGNIL